MTIETDNEKAIKRAAKETMRAEKRKQTIAFARGTLGCGKQEAKALRKVSKKYLKMDDDGLKFRGPGGKLVALDDPQVKDFFGKTYSFLLPKTAEGEHGTAALSPDLIAQAKAGNVTSKSILFSELHKGKSKAEEGETLAALNKLLAGETPKDKNGDRGNDNNPWRLPDTDPKKYELIEAKIKAIGTTACTGLAKAAGSQINGRPLQ